MVFVLAVIGCAVFTAYAAGLFFRQKSRETGVFLALGASRKQLRRELGKDLAVIALASCAAGMVLGEPLAWGVWQLFRRFLVDSQEMALLSFDPRAYVLSLAFAAYVVVILFLLGGRSVRRTNIIDIVQESHTSEPIRDVKGWYGWAGILLVAVGALAGYLMPSFFVGVLHWYPPEGLTAGVLPAGPHRPVYDAASHGGQRLAKAPQVPGHHRHLHDEISGPPDGAEHAGDDPAHRRGLLRRLLCPHALHQLRLQLLYPAGGL